ncbi:MAG: L,D-transpeptidase family protein [Candidatus Binataceae bacterium]
MNRIAKRHRARAIAILAFAAMLIVPGALSAGQSAQPFSSATPSVARTISPSAIASPAATPSAAISSAVSAAIPSAVSSPIPARWAPQPGTAAFNAAPAAGAQAAPSAGESPAANPSSAVSSAASPASPCCGDAPAAAAHRSPQALTAGERAYYHTRDGSYLDPSNWTVMIFKSRHQVQVYYKGELFRAYHAVFGRSREHGAKLYEGDRRTPEGVYEISGKHPSARWHWFLTLDYPNAIDRLRYAALSADDVAPAVRDGRVIREGGSIGIHGTDVPMLNSGDINWTTGCISLDNPDVAQLHRLLPIGTVVIINP